MLAERYVGNLQAAKAVAAEESSSEEESSDEESSDEVSLHLQALSCKCCIYAVSLA